VSVLDLDFKKLEKVTFFIETEKKTFLFPREGGDKANA